MLRLNDFLFVFCRWKLKHCRNTNIYIHLWNHTLHFWWTTSLNTPFHWPYANGLLGIIITFGLLYTLKSIRERSWLYGTGLSRKLLVIIWSFWAIASEFGISTVRFWSDGVANQSLAWLEWGICHCLFIEQGG